MIILQRNNFKWIALISILALLVTSCGGGSESSSETSTASIVTVDSHSDNTIVKESPIIISGTVDIPDATVMVDDVEAVVVDGQFSASVNLAEGVNALDVVAQNDTEQFTVSLSVALNTTQMCGTGDTFDVGLPGIKLPNDPSTRLLKDRTLRDDFITLPKGCSIYTIIVHGYARNANLDELMYYKLAKFVAENNGYVHWSWWNNFLGEYMARPLHASPAILQQPEPGSLIGDGLAFGVRDGNSKAVPHEDYQFQADAKRVLKAIKRENPDAIIIVAGHSMGGNAVARLGRDTNVDINLLAPIDPVGNRNKPVGFGESAAYQFLGREAAPGYPKYTPGNETFNWTRWRATRRFRGFKQRDCVRGGGLFGNLCKDFDSHPFRTEYRCTYTGWQDKPPPRLAYSKKPIKCPQKTLIYDRGIPTTFGSNIKRLYHRWQQEATFPYDFKANYYFDHWAQRSDSIFGANYQESVGAFPSFDGVNVPALAPPTNWTCADESYLDPRGAISFNGEELRCKNWDGHGEIIGMRAVKDFTSPLNRHLHPLALSAQSIDFDWPSTPWLAVEQSGERRARLIQMANPGSWPYEPVNPDLDLVVDDMVAITQRILNGDEPVGEDVTPPESSASLDVEPNAFGWNNTDVVVTLSAIDEEGGSGVKEIIYTMTGAETGDGIHEGNSLELALSAEGTTTIEYYARDNAGNQEEMNTLVVNIDKTAPTIEATVDPQANQHGWNNTDVTVMFTAEDALSGIDTVSDPITVTAEGANQEIIGVATDRAGNTSAAGVILNIDKTPPVIIGMPENCSLWPPNHKMVEVAEMVVTDELSGVDTVSVDGVSNELESGPGYGNTAPDIIITDNRVELRSERYTLGGRVYDLTASAVDLAGNTAEGTGSCIVPHDQGK